MENMEMEVIIFENNNDVDLSSSNPQHTLANVENNLEKAENFNFDGIASMSDQEIEEFRDDRGFNILMLAAEAGRLDIVQSIIDAGDDVDFNVDGETTVNLAYKGGHHEVVLALLKANSKFPENIQRETASDKLKEFIDLSSKMHEKVGEANENDLELLKDYLKDRAETNSSLRHFYNPVNNFSLLKFAILSKKFLIYEFLIFLNIFLAPHESMDNIVESLSDEEREELSNINFRISPNLITEPIMILMRNCKLGPDSPKGRDADFMFFIRQAFDELFMIPAIAIVLRIVAASRNFKIVFDFKRDSVTFLDPKSEPFCAGLMYLNGKIYIGAKDMFSSRWAITVSTIAHELTHYAMFLVYGNWAKPYKKKDKETKTRFNAISDACERLKDAEEIVRLVYDCYEEEMWHAELIVRVPHMIAAYFQDIELMNGLRETFRNLFEFYEQTCMPQMEAELPRIERKFSPFKKIEKKVKKHKALNWLLIVLIVFGSILSIFTIFSLLPLSWSDLNLKDQNFIKNSKVEFYGVEVKFGELFANDSKVFDSLSSEQIKKTLKGETEELSRALNETFHHQVFLTWSNMTKELKEKFLTREVDFQGQKVSIGNLTRSNRTLKLLNSEKVRKIFTSEILKISSVTEEKSKIFIERYFTDENLKVLSEESYKLEYDDIRRDFQAFYKNGKVNTENPNVTNFDQIANQISNSKVFLLSSAAGDGKSTTFRHFRLELKEKFPRKWIQFVDLKKHFEAFDKGQQMNLKDSEVLANFLGEKVLNLKDFELELFKELFASGDVIFLWDGVDEISPKFKNFMLDLTENILRTQNFQFISTRPQHSKDFEEKLKVKAQKLIPFSELDRFEFLVKTIADLKFNESGDEIFEELKHFYNQTFEYLNHRNASKYLKTIAKGKQIFYISERAGGSIYQDSFVSNPLLISMISEISCDENFEITDDGVFNLFQLYETFVIKKLGIVDEKGQIIKSERDEVLASSSINIWQVHQFFALDLLVKGSKIKEEKSLNFIESKVKESLSSFTAEQISRFGILQVNSKTDFDFAHRSFAEFFIAQYFLDNIFLKSKRNEIQNENHKWKIELLFGFESKAITQFISDARVHKKYNFDDDSTFVSQLIKNAYSNDLQKFFNVLNFIRELPDIEQAAVGLSALFEEMKSKNDLESFKLMIIDYLVKDYMQEKNYPNLLKDYNKFETLKHELSEKSNEGVEEFGAKIRSGKDFQELNEWAEKFNEYGESFELALPDLIKSAYSNDSSEFLNVLKFIRDLPDIPGSAVSFSALYKEMKLKNDFESLKLMMIDYLVKEYMQMPSYQHVRQDYKNNFETLKLELSEKSKEIKKGVEEFGAKIRNGKDYLEIIEWAEKLGTSGRSFELALPNLIKSAYSNDFGNFQKVFNFIRDLPFIGDSAVGLSALYDEMSSSEDLEGFELLMLAQETKRVVDLPDFPTRDEIYKEKLENLKKVFSSSVRDFIWSSRENCTIKSESSSEILFAPDLTFDNESAQVLTSTQENFSNPSFKWLIQTENFARTFSIKNEAKKNFLMASDENFKADRRRVLLAKSGEEKSEKFYWKIIPKNEKFLIVNVYFNESLIASDEKVFTSKLIEKSAKEGKWEIKCDP